VIPSLILIAMTDAETSSLAEEIRALRRRLDELEARAVEDDEREVEEDRRAIVFHAYGDFGAFYPFGDGSGVVLDAGKVASSELLDDVGWVFLGDLLSTTINSRGEVADLGELPGVMRFDSVNSRGAGGFILNEVNATASFTLWDVARFTASVNFVPRTGSDFSIGDFIEVDLAQLEWFATEDHESFVAIAGKISPVFGVEYRDRKADKRFGITPSLLERYTSGTPLGLAARSTLFDGWLRIGASFTNGTSTTEQFHFYDEIDSNDGKTLAGRIGIGIPLKDFSDVFAGRLELGVSGQWGPQDRATDSAGAFWLAGADLTYSGVALQIKGEIMKGRAPGDAVDGAYELDLDLAAFLEVDYSFFSWLGALARVDFRDAIVALGTERAYVSHVLRFTIGLRSVVSPNLILKVEFLRNEELGILPSIDNDVITSSLLVIY
jgi:hypothetical protein